MFFNPENDAARNQQLREDALRQGEKLENPGLSPGRITLQGLKVRARQQRTKERTGQNHWFTPQGSSPYTRTGRSPQAPGIDEGASSNQVEPQSCIDAILDLLAFGSTHYSSKRK